jgi:poly-gamma-glutamate synthesis protein (capsule biosynthesis protein)
MEPLGVYADARAYKAGKGYTIKEVEGVKIAFVAFTKGMDGMTLPQGSEHCVNVLYKDYDSTYQTIDRDNINRIMDNVEAEKPDLTVAMLHWGSEYNDTISETQQDIVELMQKNGVDVILGTHPHRVQELSHDSATGNFVAYSLGDFFGDGAKDGTKYSILLDLEITKDNETGLTKVTDFSYTPLYILSENEGKRGRQVVRVSETMSAYDVNFVDKVTGSAYTGMQTSLTRISNRVEGKYK